MDASNRNALVARREFLGLFSGIVGALGVSVPSPASVSASSCAEPLEDTYLEKGLTGMARSKGWFSAHLGAAVLAGYYLCRENRLPEATVAGIRKQLDALIRAHQNQFLPFPQMAPDSSLIDRVAESLSPSIQDGLRAHGHAVIYTALSTRALRDVPHMATSVIIEELCGHNQAIGKLKPMPQKGKRVYAGRQEMVESLFDSLLRFQSLLGRPSVRRPNFTHMTTHTEALMSLDVMGYQELANAGYPGQQTHISEPVPEFDPNEHPLKETPVSLREMLTESYWESEDNQKQWNAAWNETTNPNGYWVAFGHLFKVLYSFHRLMPYVNDQAKVRTCSEILLERYLNPSVKGG